MRKANKQKQFNEEAAAKAYGGSSKHCFKTILPPPKQPSRPSKNSKGRGRLHA